MYSAILWYDQSANTLKLHGFVINTYVRYITNSTIENKQCTIAWYVDGKKVLHVDEHMNTSMIEVI